MKKILATLILPLGLALLQACGGWVETSDNGPLDGYWQLTAVDTLGGGTADLRQSGRFMAVQGSVIQMYATREGMIYDFRFDYRDGRLTFSDPRLDRREEGDPAVTDVTLLQPFGIQALTETFAVSISGSRMTLTGSRLVVRLRRF